MNLAARFEAEFGRAPETRWFSPGRINLIGEHTDYNGGWVLPVAIGLGNRFLAAANPDRCLQVRSTAFDEPLRLGLDDLGAIARAGDWRDYFAGVLLAFGEAVQADRGLDVLVDSGMPMGSGLSSSASITTGLATVLNDFWGVGYPPERLARLAQAAENDFVGLACGILDPYAIAMNRADHALLVNCDALEPSWVPFPCDAYTVLAADTGVPRRLAESPYNQRRGECQRALSALQQHLDLSSLSALRCNRLAEILPLLEEPTLQARVRHVVTENQRVLDAAASLRGGDMDRFGALLNASHESLRDDYQVSCPELDAMFEAAIGVSGVLGAKMTGAGFGGSVVVVLQRHAVDAAIETLSAAYRRRSVHRPRFHVCTPVAGVSRMALGI